MKTVDELKAFWDALPTAPYFPTAYGPQLDGIALAQVEARAAEAASLAAQARHRRSLADLREQVETDASAEGAPPEIERAKPAALRCALVLAGTPAD